MSEFEDWDEAHVDVLLRRAVPGEESTSPDSDLIARVRSIALRRKWTNPKFVGWYVSLMAAALLIVVFIPTTVRTTCGPTCQT